MGYNAVCLGQSNRMKYIVNQSIFEKSLYNYKYSENAKFSEYMGPINRTQIELTLDRAMCSYILEFKTWLLSKTHSLPEEERGHIHFPATWWDHLKLKHFPIWFTDRWPVKYKDVPITYMKKEIRICPHDNVAWGNHDEVIHISWMERKKKT